MALSLQQRKVLQQSRLEGACHAVMAGAAETYALIRMIHLGVSALEFGLLATLPILLGALVGWVIPMATSAQHLKKALVASIGLQILGLVGLLLSSFVSSTYLITLVSLCLYWMGGMASASLWIDWIAPWVPAEKMRRFLSNRNALAALITVSVYIGVAYLALQNSDQLIFALPFGLALVARLVSWVLIITQGPSPSPVCLEKTETLRSLPLWKSRFILYAIALTVFMKFVVNLASPYFAPYMLRELSLSITDYVWLTAIPFVSRAFLLMQWGQPLMVLRPLLGIQISMFGVALVAFLWTWGVDFWYLSVVELISGMVWAMFDLSVLIFLQSISHGNVRRLLGFNAALASGAAVLGAIVGAQFLGQWSYLDLFTLSAGLRLAVGLMFLFISLEIREFRFSVQDYREFLASSLTIRPSLANVGRFVLLRKPVEKPSTE